MTQTQRARGVRTEVRWGQIYGLDVIDHDSWMIDPDNARTVRNDYIGQTRQKGRARENQHRDSQAFSDLIVGSPRVLWEGWCTDDQLDEMEQHFIQDVEPHERPRLNYLLNEDNPRRIEKYRQKEQRHERDALRGDAPWEPLPYRPEARKVQAPFRAQVRAKKPRVWLRRLAVWLGAVTTAWIVLVMQWDFAAWWVPAALSASAVSGSVWHWLGRPRGSSAWSRAFDHKLPGWLR